MTDTISADEYRALLADEKRHKYRAEPVTVDGIRFDSSAEARRYGELRVMERAGTIADLELQPRFPLLVNGIKIGTYIADFQYTDCATGELVFEDVKGVRTRLYRRSKKHVEAQYGITITEIDA